MVYIEEWSSSHSICNYTFENGREKLYTYDNVIERFNDSPFIVKEQREQFERGIKAYFDSDFLVACHLLVPILSQL